MTFDQFNISEKLKHAVKCLGFERPTNIQRLAIPLVLEGKDVIGESATGSGKTLAFGFGIIESVKPGNGIQSIVLTPTRELAQQVTKALSMLAKNTRLKIVPVFGGVSINPQIEALKSADIVVATPGRFKDHLSRKTITTSKIRLIVLDEADRMLDMGFILDIEHILRACPKNRQTLLFSATFPPVIEKLSKRYLRDPKRVMTQVHVDPSKLKQVYYDVPKSLKISLLVHLLKNENSELVMVFCNTRRGTDIVYRNLKANKIKTVALHGGFTQAQRTKSIEMFKQGKSNVLICTDVAARGLHIDGISHIYNYDIPSDPIDYVHRIGRTARAGKHGKVINVLCDLDHSSFQKVISQYSEYKIDKMKMPYVPKAVVKKIPRTNNRRDFRKGPRPRRARTHR